MSKQTINIGASPNDGTGTPLRTSFDYTNQNFTEIYTALGGGVALPGATTQVIFNDGGTNLAGDAGLVYNKTTDALTVAGLVTAGSATITGAANLNGAVNLSTAGTATVTLGSSASYGVLVGSGTNAASIYINGATASNASKLLYGAAQHEWYNSSLSTLVATLNTTGLGIGGTSATSRLQAAAANASLSSWGISSIYSTDSMAVDKGGSLVFGGSYTGSSSTYWAQIAGRKENSTDSDVAGYLAFSTRPTGGLPIERLRIDSSGNVGVGVTPSAWGGSNRSVIQFPGGAAIQGSGSLGLASFSNAFNDGTNDIYIANGAAYKHIIGTGFQWFTAPAGIAGNAITFTQAMTLDASGNLYVAKTSSSSATNGCELQTGAGGNAASVFTATAATVSIMNRLTSDGVIVDFRRQTSSVGNISVTTLATTYNTISDYRLKENAQPLVGGLARVNALKPSSYNWKSDGSAGEGFLAHELAEVVPAAVTGEKDAVNADGTIKSQGIDMSRIVPILVAAIQELTAEVNALKNA